MTPDEQAGRRRKPGPDPLRLKVDPEQLGDAIPRILKAGKPRLGRKKAKRKK